jgi:hypothetical protein
LTAGARATLGGERKLLEIRKAEMAENNEELINMCPLCKKQYPQEDNYCGTDGTQLKVVDSSMANQAASQS